MDIIKNLKSRFDSVQCDFLIAIAAIFLPFYITVVIHAIIFFKWIKQGEVKKGYEETKQIYYFLLSTYFLNKCLLSELARGWCIFRLFDVI